MPFDPAIHVTAGQLRQFVGINDAIPDGAYVPRAAVTPRTGPVIDARTGEPYVDPEDGRPVYYKTVELAEDFRDPATDEYIIPVVLTREDAADEGGGDAPVRLVGAARVRPDDRGGGRPDVGGGRHVAGMEPGASQRPPDRLRAGGVRLFPGDRD